MFCQKETTVPHTCFKKNEPGLDFFHIKKSWLPKCSAQKQAVGMLKCWKNLSIFPVIFLEGQNLANNLET